MRASTRAEYERIIRAVGVYMSENYQYESVSLDDFCAEYRYSRRSVQRAMSFFDASWRAMLATRRLGIAADRLIETDLEVAEIAKSVGYRSSAQFAKAFKSVYDREPRQYRNEAKAKAKARQYV